MSKELAPEEAIAKALKELESNLPAPATKPETDSIKPEIGYISWMLFTQLKPEVLKQDCNAVFEEYVCFISKLDLWNQLSKLSTDVLGAISEVSFRVSKDLQKQS